MLTLEERVLLVEVGRGNGLGDSLLGGRHVAPGAGRRDGALRPDQLFPWASAIR